MKASLALCLTLALTAFAGDMDNKYQKYINLLCGDTAKGNVKSVENLIDCVDGKMGSKILDTIIGCNEVTSLDAAIKKGCGDGKVMNKDASDCVVNKLNWNDDAFPKVNQTFYDCFAKVWTSS